MMTEYKPIYTVNPAVLKSIPAPIPDAKMKDAFSELERLLREALQVTSPFTSCRGRITVDYAEWDKMNNVLGAIREKYEEWKHTTVPVLSDRDRIVNEISDLLKKAGY